MIGDSLNDVHAARAAGCAVWCVPYGYNEGRPVGTLDCDAIVADFVDAARRLEAGTGATAGCDGAIAAPTLCAAATRCYSPRQVLLSARDFRSST